MDIDKVWLTEDAIWISTINGKKACEKFADYPRLNLATKSQRENYTLSNVGIHWAEIDEDLSFEGFFKEKQTKTTLYNLFMQFPELNASAIARNIGIQQSLLAAYISGTKKPSKAREQEIKNALHKIGKKLIAI